MFNFFLTNVGKNLASKIPNASTPIKYFGNKSSFVMNTKPLSMNELKDAFYYVKKFFGSLCEPLKYLFNLSIKKGVFRNDLKIAWVTPIYKGE